MKRILSGLCEGVVVIAEAASFLFVLWNIIDPPKPPRAINPKDLN